MFCLYSSLKPLPGDMKFESTHWITSFLATLHFTVYKTFAPSHLRKTMAIDCVSEPRPLKMLLFMGRLYKRERHLAELLNGVEVCLTCCFSSLVL